MRLFTFPFNNLSTILIVVSMVLSAISLIAFSGYYAPNSITVQHIDINDSTLHNAWGNLRIVHLSDLHVVKQGNREEKVLSLVKQLQPDIICITGDMVQWSVDPTETILFIRKFQAPFGVYCVMGDSDSAAGRRSCVFCHPGNNPHQQRSTPLILKNKVVEIDISRMRAGESQSGQKLLVGGIQKGESAENSLTKLLEKTDDGKLPLLLLSHFSTQWQNVEGDRALLWLSGDTHGGQILMPDFVWKWFSGKSDVAHRAGLFQDRNKWLYVNSGIGTTARFPFRFGVPPEITLLTISTPE